MKILLVGGSSSIALALHPVLSSMANVLTAGRSNSDIELDMRWGVEQFKIPSGLDCVVNLSANFGGQDFESILAAEEINAIGALKLAQACKSVGVSHMIQISSIFAERDDRNPLYNSYAMSKRHGEELLSLYCRNVGLPLLILRPSRIYGEGENYRRHQPFLYDLLDQAQTNETIVLNGSNDAIRNFIHVDDVVEIISRIIQLQIEGIFQCAGISNLQISQIAAIAVDVCDSSSKIVFDPEQKDIPDNSLEVDETLFQLINYFPMVTLDDGLIREVVRRRGEV